jgi:hypothetical protein
MEYENRPNLLARLKWPRHSQSRDSATRLLRVSEPRRYLKPMPLQGSSVTSLHPLAHLDSKIPNTSLLSRLTPGSWMLMRESLQTQQQQVVEEANQTHPKVGGQLSLRDRIGPMGEAPEPPQSTLTGIVPTLDAPVRQVYPDLSRRDLRPNGPNSMRRVCPGQSKTLLRPQHFTRSFKRPSDSSNFMPLTLNAPSNPSRPQRPVPSYQTLNGAQSLQEEPSILTSSSQVSTPVTLTNRESLTSVGERDLSWVQQTLPKRSQPTISGSSRGQKRPRESRLPSLIESGSLPNTCHTSPDFSLQFPQQSTTELSATTKQSGGWLGLYETSGSPTTLNLRTSRHPGSPLMEQMSSPKPPAQEFLRVDQRRGPKARKHVEIGMRTSAKSPSATTHTFAQSVEGSMSKRIAPSRSEVHEPDFKRPRYLRGFVWTDFDVGESPTVQSSLFDPPHVCLRQGQNC